MATNLLRLIGASKEEIEAYLGDVTSDQFIKDVKAISSGDRTKAAIAAMQGILACSADRGTKWVADNSVLFADELLKALGND